jgi:hypothetical protein
LAPNQQRVVKEKNELDERFAKLCMFCDTPAFDSLDYEEQTRLRQQADIMSEYTSILGDRIAAFK